MSQIPEATPQLHRLAPHVAVLSSYPPRACGIATYARDLRAVLTEHHGALVSVIALDEPGPPEGGRGTDPGRHGADQAGSSTEAVGVGRRGGTGAVAGRLGQEDRAGYRRLAARLNAGGADVLCVQHEYGLYGGAHGEMLLELLGTVRIPVVLNLHTVLPEPEPALAEVTVELCRRSAAVVVPARVAARILTGPSYGVDPERVTVIPHGAPGPPDPRRIGDRSAIRRWLGLAGRRVVTTFGLLGPNKGIEVALRILPGLVAARPDVLYVVLGATHPGERRRVGESYRHRLEADVAAAGLGRHVRFVNRYLDEEELSAWLVATDACLLPYQEPRQVSSGTLVRALAAGAPVVATDFPAARELLEAGGGMRCMAGPRRPGHRPRPRAGRPRGPREAAHPRQHPGRDAALAGRGRRLPATVRAGPGRVSERAAGAGAGVGGRVDRVAAASGAPARDAGPGREPHPAAATSSTAPAAMPAHRVPVPLVSPGGTPPVPFRFPPEAAMRLFTHLQRLTRPVPGLAPGALALAVYAEPDPDGGGGFVPRPAGGGGQGPLEGVACVDDAARAVVLYCAEWRRSQAPWARTAALGLLRFTLGMQAEGEEGRPANFLLDWGGGVNRDGPTSQPGGAWWTARAMHALACAAATFGPDHLERELGSSARRSLDAGLAWLDTTAEGEGTGGRGGQELGPRAIAVLAALGHWRATGGRLAAARCLRWAEHLAGHRTGEVLPDAPGRPLVRLWGRLQEAALARAGQALGRPDLVETARASAEAVLAGPAERGFTDMEVTVPYDVSCTVLGLAAVAEATGDRRLAGLAGLGRAWFAGRNRAGAAVYDHARGCVHDGIDAGRVSANAGAEAGIEAGLALLGDLPW